jgi:hypothetical protein
MGSKVIVGVQGTSGFDDYNVFLRAMAVAMSGLPEEDPYFYIYSAGPSRINAMVSEFSNLSERGLKARGKKIKFYNVPPSWIEENFDLINHFAFLSNPKEPVSKLVTSAQLKNIDVGIYRH